MRSVNGEIEKPGFSLFFLFENAYFKNSNKFQNFDFVNMYIYVLRILDNHALCILRGNFRGLGK